MDATAAPSHPADLVPLNQRARLAGLADTNTMNPDCGGERGCCKCPPRAGQRSRQGAAGVRCSGRGFRLRCAASAGRSKSGGRGRGRLADCPGRRCQAGHGGRV